MYGRYIEGSAVSVRCPELGGVRFPFFGFKCISSTVVLFHHWHLSVIRRLSTFWGVRYERFHCIKIAHAKLTLGISITLFAFCNVFE